MRLYFDDDDFDGQLQRSVGKADSGMADVGECLAIASQLTPGEAFFYHRDGLDGAELRTACPASVEAFRLALPC